MTCTFGSDQSGSQNGVAESESSDVCSARVRSLIPIALARLSLIPIARLSLIPIARVLSLIPIARVLSLINTHCSCA